MPEKTFLDKLKEKFGLNEDQISNHCSDLYVLPTDEDQRKDIRKFAEDEGWSIQNSYSNVEGNPWYGKWFVEIPFAFPDYYAI